MVRADTRNHAMRRSKMMAAVAVSTRARTWRWAHALLALVPALLGAPLLLSVNPALAQQRHPTLPLLTNFTADAARAQKEHLPILVLVSIERCPYCEQIRRSHLIPLSRQANPGVLIREVDLRSSQLIKEPVSAASQAGRNARHAAALPTAAAQGSVTHAQWAQRYGVRVAPTVLLLSSSGELLAEPLVGASIPDFYGAYLEERIETAKRKLAAG